MNKLDICNLALMRCGAPAITAIDEGSTESDALNRVYDMIRQMVLRSFAWPFALTTAELVVLDTTPADYDYEFQLPSDCLRVVAMVSAEDTVTSAPSEYVIRGKQLLTNEEEVTVLYISDEDDPAVFDALFCDAFAWRLAAEIAEAIRGELSSKRRELMVLHSDAMRQARVASGREHGIKPLRNYSDFVSARG